MTPDQETCAEIADALATLAGAARPPATRVDPVSGRTDGIAALVGAIILLAKRHDRAPDLIQVAIDALVLSKQTISDNLAKRSRAS